MGVGGGGGVLTWMEPVSLMLHQTEQDIYFTPCFWTRPQGKNPSSALAQSTSGLNSQTSHHTAAEHNVTHVGVCPAPSQDLQLRQD